MEDARFIEEKLGSVGGHVKRKVELDWQCFHVKPEGKHRKRERNLVEVVPEVSENRRRIANVHGEMLPLLPNLGCVSRRNDVQAPIAVYGPCGGGRTGHGNEPRRSRYARRGANVLEDLQRRVREINRLCPNVSRGQQGVKASCEGKVGVAENVAGRRRLQEFVQLQQLVAVAAIQKSIDRRNPHASGSSQPYRLRAGVGRSVGDDPVRPHAGVEESGEEDPRLSGKRFTSIDNERIQVFHDRFLGCESHDLSERTKRAAWGRCASPCP